MSISNIILSKQYRFAYLQESYDIALSKNCLTATRANHMEILFFENSNGLRYNFKCISVFFSN